MNLALRRLVLLLSFVSVSLYGEIVETMHIEELRNYVDAETLILFDLDNTLIENTQTLGRDQWFCRHIQEYTEQYGSEEGFEKALLEYHAVQWISDVNLVEEGADRLVRELQDEGFSVMGLTTRGIVISSRTLYQLKTVSIDLSTTAPTDQDLALLNERWVLYKGGVLFTDGTHKGGAFQKFLAAADLKPSRVLFINDKAKDLRQVEEGCEQLGIPFLGLRYGYTDEKVKAVRMDLAGVQLEYFGKILSNQEAESLLR